MWIVGLARFPHPDLAPNGHRSVRGEPQPKDCVRTRLPVLEVVEKVLVGRPQDVGEALVHGFTSWPITVAAMAGPRSASRRSLGPKVGGRAAAYAGRTENDSVSGPRKTRTTS